MGSLKTPTAQRASVKRLASGVTRTDGGALEAAILASEAELQAAQIDALHCAGQALAQCVTIQQTLEIDKWL